MLRAFAVAAMLSLALPTLALAEEHKDEHKGAPPPHPGGPPPHPPGPPPHPPGPPPHPPGPPPHPPGPPGPPPHPPGPPGPPPGPPPHPPGPPGPPPGAFHYHGHEFHPVHVNPFVYPPGWGYQRWAIGAVVPPWILARDYWYTDWAALGFDPPPPGYQWVRYGPDLLLVNVVTGQVAEVVPDVFY